MLPYNNDIIPQNVPPNQVELPYIVPRLQKLLSSSERGIKRFNGKRRKDTKELRKEDS